MNSRCLSALFLLAGAPYAPAMDLVVDRIDDGGAGSLRAAIDAANAAAGADRIVFADALAGQTITLAAPTPTLTDATEILGPTTSPAILRSAGDDRVLAITTAPGAIVALHDLVLAGGRRLDTSGGCLAIQHASVLLERVRVTDCEAVFGGAIAASGGAILELEDSRVDHALARRTGGGIYAAGALFIGNSEIDHNAVDGAGYISGGGVYFGPPETQSMLWILDSRLHENTAMTSTPDDSGSGSTGGALDASRGSVLVERSSFYGNRALYGAALNRTGFSDDALTARIVGSTFANNQGDQILSFLVGSATIEFSTVSGNEWLRPGMWGKTAVDAWATVPLRISGSVIAGNAADGTDVATHGAAADVGRSLIGSAAAGAIDPTHPGDNLLGIAPRLYALAFNGGPTPTMVPKPGSPLLDAAGTADLPATDQRGYARLVGSAADIGAVEDDGDRLFADAFEVDPGS
ncbi:MAG TPA: choice-of-anchor Q domain-containing protein [Dokdonella sp.]|nr:choice-of-anchor Q domain-containing protein [Dokdonella sp.]